MKFVLILLGISAPIVIHNYFVDALIGGEPARLGEVPYIVQVLALDTRSGHYSRLCDGALMDQFNFVLPGHCAYSCRAFQNCRAYAGRLGTTGGGVELTIIKINVHKLIEAFYANGSFRLGSDPWYIWDFKPTPRIADIGLINTEYVPFDENVSAAKPPKTEVPANNNDDIYNVTVSGWGVSRFCDYFSRIGFELCFQIKVYTAPLLYFRLIQCCALHIHKQKLVKACQISQLVGLMPCYA